MRGTASISNEKCCAPAAPHVSCSSSAALTEPQSLARCPWPPGALSTSASSASPPDKK